ncbi:thrombospondin-2-like [Ruditapes philippinarum]|uniref:thrombospondin-2-like n=1 Tax=Ruditapes philippinarum TaxID=129788 RepID=UPI00295B73AD|nr:thrombospondin-2-like [Ruditapes philippinarum]
MCASVVLRIFVLGISITSAILDERVTCQLSTDEITKLESCRINGNWTQWSDWQACSTTCGTGLTRRSRKCVGPATPSILSQGCQGDGNDYRLCFNSHPCPINGFWSEWSPWVCYIFGGQRVRQRSCYGPMFGGVDCAPATKIEYKNDTSCH